MTLEKERKITANSVQAAQPFRSRNTGLQSPARKALLVIGQVLQNSLNSIIFYKK
jgi:hypothetical protein